MSSSSVHIITSEDLIIQYIPFQIYEDVVQPLYIHIRTYMYVYVARWVLTYLLIEFYSTIYVHVKVCI